MKKVVSIVLSVLIIIGATVPAFATVEFKVNSSVPVIYIAGDSGPLAYDDETKEFTIGDLFKIFKNSEDGNISEAAFNILRPFLIKGIVFNDWDDYYDAVYKEISDVYKPILLDENGNPNTDCDIPKWQKDLMARAEYEDRKNPDGTYNEKAYVFYYDWRLDPIELADQLNAYIEDVKKATGHDKVSLTVKCLGSNTVLSYINKYSTNSLKGVGIDVSTSMGADFMSGMLSGDFGVDANSISRFITDYSERDDFYTDIVRFVTSTINLLESTGVIDTLGDVARAQLYSKIEYGIISALARSTFMTFPGYWAVVEADDFDKALTYVFGEEGSEKRIQYKGLIDKITNYNDTIKKNVYPIMQKLTDDGVNLCVVAKYGMQMVPTLKDGSILGDDYVSVYNASFGATTSTVYDTLSDDYIAGQVEKGLGRYISPDKQIDASTCLFPDYTWFFKGLDHGHYISQESNLLITVMDADRQLTVDDFDLTQYIVYDNATDTIEPMTEENCHNEYWTADEKVDRPTTKSERIRSIINTFIKWLTNLLKMFTYFLNGGGIKLSK
ncbi:MAG: hypothetical protein ACI4XE_01365 [Acutalibacteraceae bacterium]